MAEFVKQNIEIVSVKFWLHLGNDLHNYLKANLPMYILEGFFYMLVIRWGDDD
jgi:hypothetical protein